MKAAVEDASIAAESASASGRASSDGRREPLRVCHVGYTFYESDNRLLRYATSLVKRGDTVDVLALRRPGGARRAELNGVQVYCLQQRNVNERQAWVYFLKVVLFALRATCYLGVRHVRRRYDVVHVHNIPDFLVFAAIVPRLMGARVILDIHDVVPELYSGKFGAGSASFVPNVLLRVERASCRFADHVIVANHLWQQKLVQRSVSTVKCTALMNYPDTTIFRMATAPTKALEPFTFLYHGTLNRHQGLDIAVAAFAKAAPALPNAELHIYGEGPTRSSLQEQALRLGVGERVKFMSARPLTEIAQIVAAADVGIVPKRADGFGNEAFSTKVLEFMACGVPVIVARTKVDDYYFRDTQVRFFTPGSDDDLAVQMRWAFEQRDERARIAAAGHDYAREQRWEKHEGAYFSIVDRLGSLATGEAPHLCV